MTQVKWISLRINIEKRNKDHVKKKTGCKKRDGTRSALQQLCFNEVYQQSDDTAAKNLARRIVYNAIEKFAKKIKAEDPLPLLNRLWKTQSLPSKLNPAVSGALLTKSLLKSLLTDARHGDAMDHQILARKSRTSNGRGPRYRIDRLLQQPRFDDQEKRRYAQNGGS